MVSLPDLDAYVKVIWGYDGTVIPDGYLVFAPTTATIRFVVVNDSNQPAVDWSIVYSVKRNGAAINPPGVFLVNKITVQPNTLWKTEWAFTDPGDYEASIHVSNAHIHFAGQQIEEDSTNNAGKVSFIIHPSVE